jgi:hypothetical protein
MDLFNKEKKKKETEAIETFYQEITDLLYNDGFSLDEITLLFAKAKIKAQNGVVDLITKAGYYPLFNENKEVLIKEDKKNIYEITKRK